MESLQCPCCTATFPVVEFFDSCVRSVSDGSAVVFICPLCSKHSAFIVQDGKVVIAEQFFTSQGVTIPDLVAKTYQGFVHVWYKSKHWAISSTPGPDA